MKNGLRILLLSVAFSQVSAVHSTKNECPNHYFKIAGLSALVSTLSGVGAYLTFNRWSGAPAASTNTGKAYNATRTATPWFLAGTSIGSGAYSLFNLFKGFTVKNKHEAHDSRYPKQEEK